MRVFFRARGTEVRAATVIADTLRPTKIESRLRVTAHIRRGEFRVLIYRVQIEQSSDKLFLS
jgi:hypothetical protein